MGRAFLALAVLAASGCSLVLSDREGPEAGDEPDGGAALFRPFGGIDPVDADSLAGRLFIDDVPCTIDTGEATSSVCGAAGVSLRHAGNGVGIIAVVEVDEIVVTASGVLRVEGDFPLAIVARTISVATGGRIDAGSTAAGEAGPGAVESCDAAQLGAPDGGAGFGGNGGDGGDGGDPGDTGLGGAALAAPPLVLRAGCGDDNAWGGGGLQLSAAESIAVGGFINVGGAGGPGAPTVSTPQLQGGAGGASGGMIVLDSLSITLSAADIGANGGGGGSGRDVAGNTSSAGSDAVDTQCARGGIVDGAVPGGQGGCDVGPTSSTGSGEKGGDDAAENFPGGGGGGVGFVLVRGANPVEIVGSTVSPEPIAVP